MLVRFVYRRFAVLACCAAALTGPAPPAEPPTPVTYRPPVAGPVTAPFAAPADPYGPGHRGVDYRTAPGATVVAAAAGAVTFAGPVAGALDVVVAHADRIRTTYAGLASITVRSGDRVDAGQPVGTADGTLHFGARAGTAYVDPAVLLAPTTGRARLVPLTLPAASA